MGRPILEHSPDQSVRQTDAVDETGRIVVHTVGDEAGLIRLDIELANFTTPADVQKNVRLVIPGEVSPLQATDVVADRGRFVLSYFSSDIANAGHLPATAVVMWDLAGQTRSFKIVRIESAEQVEQDEGEEAVNIPGGDPTVVYPATVGLMAILSLIAGIVAAVVVLQMQ